MIGDRICVVGAGMVGCCIARLLAAIPGVEVTLVDVDPTRAEVAESLGVSFAHPAEAGPGCDLVFHASATEAGLQRSLELLAADGEVIDLSWYGDASVRLDLGGAFHSGRLRIRASQVGEVALPRRHRRTRGDRLRLALDLLHDPAYDALSSGASAFEDLPELMADLTAGRRSALVHTITYPQGA